MNPLGCSNSGIFTDAFCIFLLILVWLKLDHMQHTHVFGSVNYICTKYECSKHYVDGFLSLSTCTKRKQGVLLEAFKEAAIFLGEKCHNIPEFCGNIR